jgi:hypothetical protein
MILFRSMKTLSILVMNLIYCSVMFDELLSMVPILSLYICAYLHRYIRMSCVLLYLTSASSLRSGRSATYACSSLRRPPASIAAFGRPWRPSAAHGALRAPGLYNFANISAASSSSSCSSISSSSSSNSSSCSSNVEILRRGNIVTWKYCDVEIL